jgi:hypothetical protein
MCLNLGLDFDLDPESDPDPHSSIRLDLDPHPHIMNADPKDCMYRYLLCLFSTSTFITEKKNIIQAHK